MSVKEKIANRIVNASQSVKSGFVFTIATMVTKGIAFLTVPVFTRIMPSDQIGIVSVYNSWFSMLSVITTLSLTSGGYQLALKEFSDKKDSYESSVLTITTGMSLLFAGIYFLLTKELDRVIGLPKSLIILMLIGFVVSPAQEFWMSRQRYDYKYKLSGSISIISAVAASALSLMVVLLMKKGGHDNLAEGRLWANYIIMYGVAAAFWVYIMVKGKTFYHKEYWKFSLTISIPLIGHAISKQILDVSDRQMISRMVGNSEVGIYSTLYTISSISLIAWNAINASYVPYLFKNIDDKDKKKNIQKSSMTLLMAYSLFAVLITFVAPEIIRILAPAEYYSAIYIMPPIAMGVSLTAISNMYSNVLIYYKKSKTIMLASATAAAMNLILNFIFIQLYGYQAAAYTTLVSYVVLTLIEAIVATKVYKAVTGSEEMIYSNRSITVLAVASFAISMFALVLYRFNALRYGCCVLLFGALILIYKKRSVREHN